MKVSIITVCYNSINTIKDTIESVIGQDYPFIEYIIIDGGSNDGTVSLVKKYDKYVNHFISENDLGMYDAINKGINISTGDLIGVLHSDDIFSSSKIISKITNKLISSEVDSIYGDLDYVDINNRNILRHWESGSYHKRKFLLGWMPPHPTFFVKKNIFKQYGLYNISFGTAADYELIIRFLYRYEISCVYLPEIVTKMKIGGLSNKAISNRLKAHIQDWRAWIYNGIFIFPIWVILKPLRKISQYY